ncbi:hypothetical protein Ancab_034797 [Ancistrocladus abbreviatus]
MFGMQGGRGYDDDQFYTPVKSRRSKKHVQKQQQQHNKIGGTASEERDESKSKNKMENSGENWSTKISNLLGLPPLGQCNHSISNLDRFLESTTPLVLSQYFSKTTMRGWRTCDVEYQHYFTLDDLWEAFKEWSAYGAGVPLAFDGYDYGVVQYYVPYLSAIQLYGQSPGSNLNSRQAGEGSDGDEGRVSGSDGSSDYEIEEGMDLSWLQQGCQTGSLLSLDKDSQSREGFSSDASEAGSSSCQLLFEFLEQETPYCREPLSEKIADLSNSYPGLKTLRSCNLLPRSWISVAWYPIYRIPTGPTLRDLDACFLTYHYLSSPVNGSGGGVGSVGSGGTQTPTLAYESKDDEVPRFLLPAFALAVYKFKGAMWTPQNGATDCPLVNSLMRAAYNWLRIVQVNHPDFQFFVSRGSYER